MPGDGSYGTGAAEDPGDSAATCTPQVMLMFPDPDSGGVLRGLHLPEAYCKEEGAFQ